MRLGKKPTTERLLREDGEEADDERDREDITTSLTMYGRDAQGNTRADGVLYEVDGGRVLPRVVCASSFAHPGRRPTSRRGVCASRDKDHGDQDC